MALIHVYDDDTVVVHHNHRDNRYTGEELAHRLEPLDGWGGKEVEAALKRYQKSTCRHDDPFMFINGVTYRREYVTKALRLYAHARSIVEEKS